MTSSPDRGKLMSGAQAVRRRPRKGLTTPVTGSTANRVTHRNQHEVVRHRAVRHRRWTRRVPIRHQLTETECAAACLAMVASYHGRDTGVSECRDALGIGRDGVSIARLISAAERFGFRVKADGRTDPLEHPPSSPAIVFFADHHFAVLERVGRRGVRVADPAAGRTWMPSEEFTRRYGNVLLRLNPGRDFARRRRPLRQALLLRYLREFVAVPGGRRLLGLVTLCAIALQGIGLVLPVSTKVVVDGLVPGSRSDLLPVFGIAVLGTALLSGTLTLARALTLLALRKRADTALSRGFVRHLLRLPLRFFLHRSRGDLLLRLASVSSTREAVTQRILTLVLDLGLLVGYLAALVLVAPVYLLVVGVLAALHTLLLARAFVRMGTLAQRELAAKSEEQSQLVEALEAVVPVKANGAEPQVEQRWATQFDKYLEAMVRRGRFSAFLEAMQNVLTVGAPLALLWLGVAAVLDGRMTLGTALAANSVAVAVLSPVQTMAAAGQTYSMLRSQIERVYDVIDAAAEQSGTRRLGQRASVRVDVDDVSFRYHADGPNVLSDISFTVPPGGKLGIVGRTGSGKSTIALLLLGLVRAESGEIRHDGIPVAALDLAALRSACGAVLQDLNLFNGTIRDNIVLGREGINDDDLARAAGIAGLHADVARLPMGYATPVGSGGGALSAGQRQRIALARALVHRPRLLILDEATSHLDPATERRVDEALSRLEVTRVVISHRLSAVRNADQILVVQQGRIVERGRHEDLVAHEGIYRDLFGEATAETAPAGARRGGLQAL
jgi:ABC-type bacteriocin/lantibiotic exporter with double-glycine peptidase domain